MIFLYCKAHHSTAPLKVHKIENFFDSDFGICVISLLVMHNNKILVKKFFDWTIMGRLFCVVLGLRRMKKNFKIGKKNFFNIIYDP